MTPQDRHLGVVRGCLAWESASTSEVVREVVKCRTGVALAGAGSRPRLCYIGVASPIEQILRVGSVVIDRDGSELAAAELVSRLLDGQVAAVTAPRGEVESGLAERLDVTIADSLIDRRQAIRRVHVRLRFLLRQIGLMEVSAHRGAPVSLYRAAAHLWSRDVSLCVDPAMLLTLGADRQRFVDEEFNERARYRLPRAMRQLHELGVIAHPRLVIV